MICSHCGKEFSDSLFFCIHCGQKVQPLQTPEPVITVDVPSFAPVPPTQLPPEPEPEAAQKKRRRKLPVFLGIIAVILIAALTTGLLTNWLGYYGPTTKIGLATKRTIQSGSFTASVNLSVGRFSLKELTVKLSIDTENQELTLLCTNQNSIIQFAIYQGYYLERLGFGRYQATDIRDKLDSFFNWFTKEDPIDWETAIYNLSPELHETLEPQMDFNKTGRCMKKLFRQSNSPVWLEETARLTTTRERGSTTYEFRPNTTTLAQSCLECFRPAFYDSDDFDTLLESWDKHLEQLPSIDLQCTIESRYLTSFEIATEIEGNDLQLTAKISDIGNTHISEKTLQECLDNARKN